VADGLVDDVTIADFSVVNKNAEATHETLDFLDTILSNECLGFALEGSDSFGNSSLVLLLVVIFGITFSGRAGTLTGKGLAIKQIVDIFLKVSG